MRNKELYQSYESWRDFAVEQRKRRHLMTKVLLRIKNLKLGASYGKWSTFVAAKRANEHKVRGALTTLLFKELRASFATWLEVVDANAEKREKTERAALCFVNRALFAALNGWRTTVEMLNEHRRLIRRSLAKVINRELAMAIERWTAYVDGVRKTRLAIGHRARALQRTALQTFARENRVGGIARRGVRKFLMRQQSLAWESWYALYDEARAKKERAMAMATKTIHRMKNMALVGAFTAMVHHAIQQIRLRSLMSRVLMREAYAALLSWMDHTYKMQRARELAKRALMGGLEYRFVTWKELMLDSMEIRKETYSMVVLLKNNRTGLVSKCRRCMSKWHMPETVDAFKRWVAYVEDENHRRYTRQKAYQFFYGATARKVFAQFSEAVFTGCQLRRVMLFWVGKASQKAFVQWSEYVVQFKEFKAKTEKALYYMVGNTLKFALYGWFHAANEMRTKKTAKLRAAVSFESRTLRKAWLTWTTSREKVRNQRAKLQWALGTMAGFRLTIAFNGWLAFAACQQQLLAGLQDLYERCMARRTHEKLVAWFDYSMRRKYHAKVIARLSVSRYLDFVVDEWRRLCNKERGAKLLRQRAVMRMVYASLAEGFFSWLDAAAQAAEGRRKVALSLSRIINRELFMAFNTWHTTAQRIVYQRACVARTLGKIRMREAAAALDTWRDVASNRALNQAKMGTALSALKNRRVRMMMNSWIEYTLDRIEQQARVERALRRFTNAASSAAFSGWLSNVEVARETRERTRKAMNFFLNAELTRGFYAFRENVAQALEDRERARRALIHFVHGALYSALKRWMEMREEAQRHRTLVSKSLSSIKNRAVRACFNQWDYMTAIWVNRRARVTDMMDRRFRRDRGTFLRCWHEYVVWTTHTFSVLDGAMRRIRNKALFAAWDAWSSFIEERAKMRRAASFLVKRAMAMGFAQWKALYAEVVLGRKMMRAGMYATDVLRAKAFAGYHDAVLRSMDYRSRLKKAYMFCFGTLLQHSFQELVLHTVRMQKVRWFLTGSHEKLLKEAVALWRDEATFLKAMRFQGAFLRKNSDMGRVVHLYTHWRKSVRARRWHDAKFAQELFQTWKWRVAYAKEMRAKQIRAIQMIRNGCMYRCFRRWSELAKLILMKRLIFLRKQRSIKMALIMGDELIAKRRIELLASTFMAWRLTSSKFKLVKNAIESRMRVTMFSCFRAWVDYVRRRNLSRENEDDCSVFFDRVLIRGYLRNWRDFRVKEQRRTEKKLAKAVEFAFGQTLGFQFANWKKYVRFCQRRKRKLERIFMRLHGADERMVTKHAFAEWVDFLVVKNRGLERMDKLRHKALLTRAGEYFTRWSTYASAMRHMNVDMYDLREPINRRDVLSPEKMRESRRTIQRFSLMYGGEAVMGEADDMDSLLEGLPVTERAEMHRELHRREEPFLELHRRAATPSALRSSGSKGGVAASPRFATPAGSSAARSSHAGSAASRGSRFR